MVLISHDLFPPAQDFDVGDTAVSEAFSRLMDWVVGVGVRITAIEYFEGL